MMVEIEDISRNLMIVMGFVMYIFGSIGNLLNIFVFFQWSRTRKSSERSNSSLYLLFSSLSNLIVIIYPLLTRIIFDGFQYFVNKKTVFFLCKFRYYILHTFDFLSLSCICLAIFDRYLITSRKVRLRNLSTVQKTNKTNDFLLNINIWIHSVPIGFYFDVSNQGRCRINSTMYLYYYLWIFQIILHSIIPIIFLTVFGILTYRHLKQIQRVKYNRMMNSEKQFSRMLCLMSISIILSSIPYCIEHISYMILSNESSSYLYLYHVITSILFYVYPVTSFYIFYISTPNFRKQVKKFEFY